MENIMPKYVIERVVPGASKLTPGGIENDVAAFMQCAE